MRAEQDNRMPPRRWWQFAITMAVVFGLYCLLFRTWAPLQAGWPIIAGVFVLALIRQGANLRERRGEPRPPTGQV
ncbi:MAG TPA: hypothetical protein VF725_16095 [Ktedonobacterales bacterium]|jgi:hypothetical protein